MNETRPLNSTPSIEKNPGGKRELGKQSGREKALIGEIMDGEDGPDMTGRGRASGQICRGEAGMPIVDVKDVGAPAGVGAARELRGDPAEEPEAAMVVGPIAPVRTRIGIARPIVERRVVDQIGREFRARHPRETYPHPLRREGRVQPGGIGDAGKRIEKSRKPGNNRRTSTPSSASAGGSAAATSPSPPDLTQG